jgi:hypothetical protein
MITLKNAELIVSLISFFIVYCISISLAGAFQAWVAQQMGDPTAEEEGFLTLNPLVHIDPIGAIFLITSYFGWGKLIPINPNNIDGRIKAFGIPTGWRLAKLTCTYLADSFLYFVLALGSLISAIVLFGSTILYVAPPMMLCHKYMSHLFLAEAFPEHSSLTIVIGFIAIVMAETTVMLGIIRGISNLIRFIAALLMEHSPHMMQHGYLITFALLLIVILFGGRLHLLITSLLIHSGWAVAYLLSL